MPKASLPLACLQGSAAARPKGSTKRAGRGGAAEGPGGPEGPEGPDTECTPTELIAEWSPGCKQPRLAARGKENDGGHFVINRRPHRRREPLSGVSWDHLPDELLLRILLCLPLQELLRAARVCRRWHRLALDESLWHSVDLEGLTSTGPALQQVLKTGVRLLRCPRAFIEDLNFAGSGSLQILQMDLSSSIISTPTLESIICCCRQLEKLSLEGLQLSDAILSSLSQNPDLLQLNLSGCSCFSAAALGDLLKSCCRLEQLNISWCSFNKDHVKSVVHHLSSSVSCLNLSGYRENLTLDDVKVLVERCPRLCTLDLSDSTLLMADCFPVLSQLKHLQHLSLSRCYHIHLAALTDLEKSFPLLGLLDVFGLVSDGHLPSLRKEMPRVSINARPFSAVARPTPAGRPTGPFAAHAMWSRRSRLRFKL